MLPIRVIILFIAFDNILLSHSIAKIMNPKKTQFIIGNHKNPKKSKDFTSLQTSFTYTGRL